MKLFFSLILILLLSLNREAVAQEPMTCPDKIAMIENYVLAQLTVSILSEIYEDAGCKPEFVEYPGRRGVFYFNKGDVDGEIFRLKIIEKSTHDTIAGCHVEHTVRGFDYSDQQCFCIERKDNV